MDKKLTLIIAILFSFISANNAQVIFEENFDSFDNGDKIVENDETGYWHTWSGGEDDDARVSNREAVSGENSLYIGTTINDVYVKLTDMPFEEGRYTVSFKMFIREGRAGYFNLLHKFDGANSSWATQTFFQNGVAWADADGRTGEWDQPTGEWFDVHYVLDLEDDLGTGYHNGEDIFTWQWSKGANGMETARTFEAINFYGWSDEVNPGYYIDDIKVEKIEKPGGADIVLTGNVNADNQMELSWTDAPGAESFLILGNGEALGRTEMASMLIEKPYPQSYDLSVGAFYGLQGYRFSNVVDLEVEGGLEREFVLLEVATGTWCPNCPSAARGVDQMHDEGFNVGILEYHGGDDYEIPSARARINYYGVSGYPTSLIDGALGQLGGSYAGNDYAMFKSNYDNRLQRRAVYDFNMTVEHTATHTFKVDIEASEVFDFFDGPVELHIGLTESNIQESWQGVDELDFVVRGMYPSGDGVELDLENGENTYSYTIEMDPAFVKENCEIVAFLQNPETKEVLNGEVVKVSDILVSINEQLSAAVQVVPNPVHNAFQLNGLDNGNGVIYAKSGEKVFSFEIEGENQSIEIPELSPGAYFISVETSEGQVVKELIKM